MSTTGPDRSPVDPAIMAARYGTAPAGLSGWTLRAGIAVLVLVLGALVALQLLGPDEPDVEVQHVGYTIEDAGTATVRFTVVTEPGTTVRCTLVALNETFTQVGYREVTVGPVDAAMTSHEASVTTTELAVTASAEECRVARRG